MPRPVTADGLPEFAGRTIRDGRYYLMDKLGSGAYGKVYRAFDTTSPPDAPVFYAIKCLHKYPAGSEKDQIQQREFGFHLKVSDHPNIVTLHEYFNDGLYAYAVMDYCDGGDLFSAITEKDWYANQPEKIKHVYIQILDAVRHCHELGVFHRDIKPENILCSEDGNTIRLADFGLSTEGTFSSVYGCGSSYYMSPECIGTDLREKNVKYSTRHNDIWALGVILINLVTGRNPWRYATLDDDCFVAYSRNSNFLKQVLPISSGLNSILKRIFIPISYRRLSIAEIRQRIVGLESIYASDNLPRLPRPRPAKKAPVQPQSVPAHITPVPVIVQDGAEPSSGDTHKMASAEAGKPQNSRLSASLPVRDSPDSAKPPPPENSDPSVLAATADSSGSSGSDNSKGPITPQWAKPVDPDIEVPDARELRLDAPAPLVIDAQDQANVHIPVDKPKHPLKNTQLIKTAYQRLKGLQSGSDST